MTDEELIEQHIETKGVTVCPPRWADGTVWGEVFAHFPTTKSKFGDRPLPSEKETMEPVISVVKRIVVIED